MEANQNRVTTNSYQLLSMFDPVDSRLPAQKEQYTATQQAA